MEKINHFIQDKLEPQEEQEYVTLMFENYYDNEAKNRWEQKLSEKYKITKHGKKGFTRRSLILLITSGIAACITALIFTTSLYPDDAVTYVGNILATDELYHPDVVKGNSSQDLALIEAARAFNEQKYQEAIDLYTVFEKANTLSDKELYFKGLSHLKLDNFRKSADLLFPLLQSPTYQEEARWYYSLSLLLGENPDEAKRTLEMIKKDEWNYKNAQEISKLIE